MPASLPSGHFPFSLKLGCIVKTRVNDLGESITKVRIILDAKQSGVTGATERRYKNELPRLTDAVSDILHLMSSIKPGETIVQFVADIVDAFWLVPLAHGERRWFVAKFRGRYLVFNRTAQGSRTAPLTFAALMACTTRLLQSVLLRDHLAEVIWQDARLDTYVDDPWAALKGTPHQIDALITTLLCLWELLGYPVAYHKAHRGQMLKWIGMNISVLPDGVQVSIPEDKINELRRLCDEFLEGNVVPVKAMRSFVGKAMSIASIIHTWKPFVGQFYKAMNAPSNAPKNCLWTSQVRIGLQWIRAFIEYNSPTAICCRKWNLAEFRHSSSRVIITWDASPCGYGATLQVEGDFRAYLYGEPEA